LEIAYPLYRCSRTARAAGYFRSATRTIGAVQLGKGGEPEGANGENSGRIAPQTVEHQFNWIDVEGPQWIEPSPSDTGTTNAYRIVSVSEG
jgi:hypothetical protein